VRAGPTGAGHPRDQHCMGALPRPFVLLGIDSACRASAVVHVRGTRIHLLAEASRRVLSQASFTRRSRRR
jgi:hypothetical protein